MGYLNSITQSISRFRDMLDYYQGIKEKLEDPKLSSGKKATLSRELVFIKAKIESSFGDIQKKAIPKDLWSVGLRGSDNTYHKIFLTLESEDQIREYINFLNSYGPVRYTLDSYIKLSIYTVTQYK